MAMAFCSILRGCISRRNSHLNNFLIFNSSRSLVFPGNHTFKSFSSSSSSPWLMLPPSFEHNKLNFNFYSLSQDKVLNFTSNVKSFMGDDVDYTDIKFVSSSHGWLTLFNCKNCDLFLFNPLTNGHIKLPTIQFLPIPQKYLKSGSQCVIKLITSCSPERQDCCVMMSFGPHEKLAFCHPTITRPEWTRIGAMYHKAEDKTLYARLYEDFVYSSRQKLFYCVTRYPEEDFEAWDLPRSVIRMQYSSIRMQYSVDEENYPWTIKSEEDIDEKVVSLKYLVVDEESGDIFWVGRHLMPHMGPDSPFRVDKTRADGLPYKTVGFDVHKYDPEKCALVHMDEGSLDGLSFFVGNNHSFSIRASGNGLKLNSIYFTDVNNSIPKWKSDLAFVGHDIGIFNYEDKTFSSCYYPCDTQTITSTTMWFTPTTN